MHHKLHHVNIFAPQITPIMAHTLRFEIRKDALNSDGKAPISGIVSIKGKRKRIATDQFVYPDNWDITTQRAVYIQHKKGPKNHLGPKKGFLNESEINDINDVLEQIKSKINLIEKRYLLDGIPTSSEMIVEAYNESKNLIHIKEDPRSMVYDYIDQYIQRNERTRAKGSLVVYKSLRKHLKNFESTKKAKVRFDQINYTFMEDFRNFLVEWQEVNLKSGRISFLNNVSIHKQISTLKTFLGYAKKIGVKLDESYRTFTLKKDKLEVIALTEREFQTLLDLDLKLNSKLDKVRDVFCFSCCTGLRYSDLNQLKWDHIKGMELHFTVQKTNEPLTVPLSPQAYEILEKYKDQLRPLPIISNQKMNDYLKDLGKMAGIDDPIEIIRYRGSEKIIKLFKKSELLSVHAGRKTFATLSLEKGIPAETVMSITGHRSYASFQRYVKVTEERKRKEMERAWGKPVLKIASNQN